MLSQLTFFLPVKGAVREAEVALRQEGGCPGRGKCIQRKLRAHPRGGLTRKLKARSRPRSSMKHRKHAFYSSPKCHHYSLALLFT